jgi:hypothetical protein
MLAPNEQESSHYCFIIGFKILYNYTDKLDRQKIF